MNADPHWIHVQQSNFCIPVLQNKKYYMAEKPFVDNFAFRLKLKKAKNVLFRFSIRYSGWDVVEIIVLASNVE